MGLQVSHTSQGKLRCGPMLRVDGDIPTSLVCGALGEQHVAGLLLRNLNQVTIMGIYIVINMVPPI